MLRHGLGRMRHSGQEVMTAAGNLGTGGLAQAGNLCAAASARIWGSQSALPLVTTAHCQVVREAAQALAQACGLLSLPKLCCAVECGQLHIQAGLTCDRAKARNGGTSV